MKNIVCVNNDDVESCLTVGKEYSPLTVFDKTDGKWVKVTDDTNIQHVFHLWRFE